MGGTLFFFRELPFSAESQLQMIRTPLLSARFALAYYSCFSFRWFLIVSIAIDGIRREGPRLAPEIWHLREAVVAILMLSQDGRSSRWMAIFSFLKPIFSSVSGVSALRIVFPDSFFLQTFWAGWVSLNDRFHLSRLSAAGFRVSFSQWQYYLSRA